MNKKIVSLVLIIGLVGLGTQVCWTEGIIKNLSKEGQSKERLKPEKKIAENQEQNYVEEAIQKPVKNEDVYDKKEKMQIFKKPTQLQQPVLIEKAEEAGKEPQLSIEEIRTIVDKMRQERLKEITLPSKSAKIKSTPPSGKKIRIKEPPKSK